MAQGFFPYPGGKAQYAEWIYRHFPDHDCYVEPFGGGAGVLFHKPRSKIEVYNDIADEVWHFFDVYSRRGDELVDRLENVYYAAGQAEAWHDEIPDDPIDRAARFFFYRYANFGSKVGGSSGIRRMKHRSVADQFRDAVQALPEKRERLHGVTIENLDYAVVFDKYDSDQTLFYIDPPYVDVGDDLYGHEGEFDHKRFVDAVDDLDGYWVLSYDRLPEPLPEYETMVERKTKNRVTNGQEDEPTERHERLLMNYDPHDVDSFAGKNQPGIGDFF